MKNKMRTKAIAALCAVMFMSIVMFTGCGAPSVKNETNKYNHYQKNLKALAAKYPAFHNQLAAVSKEANTIVQQSKEIKKEDKKAEIIEKANNVFSDSTFYGQMSSFDYRLNSIQELKRDLALITKIKFRSTIKSALLSANESLNEVNTIMKNAKPTNEEQAYAEVKKANGMLIALEGKLKRVKKKTKSSEKKKKISFKRKKKK